MSTKGANVYGDYGDPVLNAVTTDSEELALRLLDEAVVAGQVASGIERPSLYYASLSGYERVVNRLIELGARLSTEVFWSTNAEDGKQRVISQSAIHEAAQTGHLGIVRALLRADGREFLSAFDDLRSTPLIWAAHGGHVDVARELIGNGSNPNDWDEAHIGFSALDEAVMNDHVELVRILLDAGADPTLATWMKMTPIDHAKSNEVRALLEDAATRTRGRPKVTPPSPHP